MTCGAAQDLELASTAHRRSSSPAPNEASSGDVRRHRFSRAGNRYGDLGVVRVVPRRLTLSLTSESPSHPRAGGGMRHSGRVPPEHLTPVMLSSGQGRPEGAVLRVPALPLELEEKACSAG